MVNGAVYRDADGCGGCSKREVHGWLRAAALLQAMSTSTWHLQFESSTIEHNPAKAKAKATAPFQVVAHEELM